MRPMRRRLPTVLAAGALLLGACGNDDGDPDTGVDTDEQQADDTPDEEDDLTRDDEAVTETGRDDEDGGTDQPSEGDEDEASEEQPERIAGEPSTDPDRRDGDHGSRAVVDVRASAHDGFDRVVFELAGDAPGAGWDVAFADGEVTSQGSGEPIDVAGREALGIAIHGVSYPGDLPDGVEPWQPEAAPGTEGGPVTEIVQDTIFEGIHTFAVGLEEEAPFLVDRLEDPERVVIDIVHE